MCEILVRAITGICEDVTGNPVRGNPVVVMPDGHKWGNCECPPEYIIVKIPGVSVDTLRASTVPWHFRVQFTVISTDPATDTITASVSATDHNPNSGVGKITLTKVGSILADWGATNIAATDNTVSFTIAVEDAAKSRLFWIETNITDIVFTQTAYVRSTGRHRFTVNYSARTFTAEQLERFLTVLAEKATIVSHNTTTKVVTIDVFRSVVRDEFLEDARARLHGGKGEIIRRRRYRLGEAFMSAAEAAGGIVTVGAGDFVGSRIDVMAE
jgi:hypothetical protein